MNININVNVCINVILSKAVLRLEFMLKQLPYVILQSRNQCGKVKLTTKKLKNIFMDNEYIIYI